MQKCFVNGCMGKVSQSWKSETSTLYSCNLHKITSQSSEIPSSPYISSGRTNSSISNPLLFLIILILPLSYLSLHHFLSLQEDLLNSLSHELNSIVPHVPDQKLIKKVQSFKELLEVSQDEKSFKSFIKKNTQEAKQSIHSMQALSSPSPISYREVLIILSDKLTHLNTKVDLLSRYFDLIFEDHENEILTLTPLDSDSEIAAGSMGGYIHYIDIESQTHSIASRSKSRVYQIVPFNHFTSAVVTGDRVLNLVSIPNFSQYRSFEGHNHWILSVTFNPNYTYMVTGSCDRLIKVWSTTDMKPLFNLSGHTGDVWAVNFDPTGKILASAGEDRSVMIWDLPSRKSIKTLKGHLGPIYSVLFTLDSRLLVTGSYDGTIRIWDLKSGKSEYTLHHAGMIRSIKLIKSDTLLLSVSGQTLRVWDFRQKQLIRELNHSATLISLAVSQDGQFIVTGDVLSRIWVWDFDTYQLKLVFGGASNRILKVEVSEDYEWLAIADEGLVRVYNLILRRQVEVIQYKKQIDHWKRLINLEGFLPYLSN